MRTLAHAIDVSVGRLRRLGRWPDPGSALGMPWRTTRSGGSTSGPPGESQVSPKASIVIDNKVVVKSCRPRSAQEGRELAGRPPDRVGPSSGGVVSGNSDRPGRSAVANCLEF